MLECLRNKVSYWDGCGMRPDKLLLNNLRGFDISFADSVTDQEKKTAEEVLNSCIDMGAQRVEDEIRGFMLPDQTAVQAFRNKTLGEPSANQKERTPDGKMYGFRIDLCRASFISFQLNRVYFYPKTDGTGTIHIYDLVTGVQKLSQAVTFTGGEVNVFVIDRLFGFDNHPMDIAIVMETSVTVYDIQPWQRSCSSCSERGRYFHDWMYANAVKIDPTAVKIESNALSASHTGGMYINYNLVCDISDYLCGAASGLKLAVWYASGSAAMDEILYSNRINSITTIHRDRAQELKTVYEAEYAKHMGQVTKNSQVPESPCFVCNAQVKQITKIP